MHSRNRSMSRWLRLLVSDAMSTTSCRQLWIIGTNSDSPRPHCGFAATVPTSRVTVRYLMSLLPSSCLFLSFLLLALLFILILPSLTMLAAGLKGFFGILVQGFHVYYFNTSGGTCCLSRVRPLKKYHGQWRGILARGDGRCPSTASVDWCGADGSSGDNASCSGGIMPPHSNID
ncbi:hypothetical protein BC939DRAFT_320622 [Gamsiella multidivaricata]|uniref:uncharacterized protein n=1 Tax=Gamsiella multidivaricata TaxID=101098 RepID=UPI00221FC8CD|nr:uncharacterized protein BC939DRAFT_320622 [Gamsiella multidivaricata]KAI7829751.1 hypothetical protein BC939DRAFT_320622 [Gamsiella multidivaricata]